MDAWGALRLQIEFGADESLDAAPVDRLAAPSGPDRTVPEASAPSSRVAGASGGTTPGTGASDTGASGTGTPDADAAGIGTAGTASATPAPGADAPGTGTAGAGPTLPPRRATALPRAGTRETSGTPAPAAARAAALAAAADSLPALRAAIAGFDGCALRATAASLVFAEGDPATGLLLIGEAPGDADDRAGRPFAGAAGAYLDRMLGSIGLDRTQLLLTPLIPWRPPGDRPPSPAERAACLPFLHRLIGLVRPRRVVLLGPVAAKDLLGAPGGRRAAPGSWRSLAVPPMETPPGTPLGTLPAPDPVPALASQDPGFLLRNPGPARQRAWADLRALRRALDDDRGGPDLTKL